MEKCNFNEEDVRKKLVEEISKIGFGRKALEIKVTIKKGFFDEVVIEFLNSHRFYRVAASFDKEYFYIDNLLNRYKYDLIFDMVAFIENNGGERV
jgi:hypothetical protein